MRFKYLKSAAIIRLGTAEEYSVNDCHRSSNRKFWLIFYTQFHFDSYDLLSFLKQLQRQMCSILRSQFVTKHARGVHPPETMMHFPSLSQISLLFRTF